jgi:hypothetical protein
MRTEGRMWELKQLQRQKVEIQLIRLGSSFQVWIGYYSLANPEKSL